MIMMSGLVWGVQVRAGAGLRAGIPGPSGPGVAGAAVDLGELVFGAGEADFQGFGFAEPAFALGFGDAGGEVVADLGDAGPLGGVWPVQGAAEVPLTELTDARTGYRYGSTDCDRRASSAQSESWSSLRVAA